jgi:hypothetical protein
MAGRKDTWIFVESKGHLNAPYYGGQIRLLYSVT